MRTRFTYLGSGFVFECVENDDGSREFNLLPEEPSPDAQEPVLATPLGEVVSCAVEAPPSVRKRSLWGVIRSAWFVVFTGIGESLTYALNNLTSLNLPPGTATAVGALGYGVKRAVWPNSTI